MPGTKTNEQEDDNEQLDVEYAKRYRSVVARGNFLAQDRPDIRYSVKELCREMSSPSCGSWRRPKKLCRYLKGTPRVVQKVKIGADLNNVVNVYVDSDWARVHKDPEEYKRRVHSAERTMPQDMEHNSDGGCSVFGRGRVLRCRERCSGRDGSSIDVGRPRG